MHESIIIVDYLLHQIFHQPEYTLREQRIILYQINVKAKEMFEKIFSDLVEVAVNTLINVHVILSFIQITSDIRKVTKIFKISSNFRLKSLNRAFFFHGFSNEIWIPV